MEVNFSQASQSLKALMDRRRQGGDVALIAADEQESLLETAHLLRSPRNAARLLAALNRAQTAPLPPTDLADLEVTLNAELHPPVHGG